MANYIGVSKPLLVAGQEAKAQVNYVYGPYGSLAEALTTIDAGIRALGLTVGIVVNDSVSEYWFQSGTGDSDLVLKQASSSGGGSRSVIVEVAGGVEDNTAFLNANYPTFVAGDKIVDTANNTVYEKISVRGWMKYFALALGATSPQTGEILSTTIYPYK